MKMFQISSFFLLISFLSFGQCPPNPELVLETQQEIDNFVVQYPNCTEIIGSLEIDGFGISNLEGLSNLVKINDFRIFGTSITSLVDLENLEEVTEYFHITNNELLTNLIGLESLAFVGGFTIASNGNLENLVGLENLVEIGNYNLHIILNSDIVNLQGLENLTLVTSQLFISTNDNLNNIDALNNLTQIRDLAIVDNDNLTSIIGLSNVESNSIINGLVISDNDNLSYCAIWPVCENLFNPKIPVLSIDNNASGCASQEEVEQDCNLGVETFDANAISIHPNPVSNTLYINTGNYDFLATKITSFLGELVLQSTERQIDFSILSSGIYFVNVETNKGSNTLKIVKH